MSNPFSQFWNDYFVGFSSKYSKTMSDWEKIRLSPFQKWKRYRRFPTKLLINILIVILTTTQVLSLNENISSYNRTSLQNWEFMLAPPSEGSSTSVYGNYVFYQIHELQTLIESIKRISQSYYSIKNTSVDYYRLYYKEDGDFEDIKMILTTYDAGGHAFHKRGPEFNSSRTTNTYFINKTNPLGPWNVKWEEQKDLSHSLCSMKITFSLENYNVDPDQTLATCYKWSVGASYDFHSRGSILMQIISSVSLCENHTDSRLPSDYLFLIICALAILNEILHIRALWAEVKIYSRAKAKCMKMASNITENPWNELNFSEKIKFFRLWFIFTTFSNACNIIASIYSINSPQLLSNDSNWRLYLTGLGCMCAWITLVQYFEYSRKWYILIATLKRSMPRVARFLIGVMPIFVGYAVFGVSYFAHCSEKFATIDASAVTLFALLNGDIISDVYAELYYDSPLLSRIFLYSFITLFIYAVLNIFIVIVEDSFFAIKEQEESSSTSAVDTLMMSLDNSKNIDIWNAEDILKWMDNPAPIKEQDLPPEKNYNSMNIELEYPFLDSTSNTQLSYRYRSFFYRSRSSDGIKNILLYFRHHAESIPTMSSDLFKSLQNMFTSLISDFEMQFKHQISLLKSQGLSQQRIRPPHSIDYYPCSFDDCIYCSLRKSYEKARNVLLTDITREINKIK